jgi:hypothetical protein
LGTRRWTWSRSVMAVPVGLVRDVVGQGRAPDADRPQASDRHASPPTVLRYLTTASFLIAAAHARTSHQIEPMQPRASRGEPGAAPHASPARFLSHPARGSPPSACKAWVHPQRRAQLPCRPVQGARAWPAPVAFTPVHFPPCRAAPSACLRASRKSSIRRPRRTSRDRLDPRWNGARFATVQRKSP